jgi:ABC-type phosphate/phosphonate transport system permease subunit
MFYSELFIKIITNVLFISLYIAIFFFTYGSVLEKQVVKEQMAFLVNNISNIIKLFGPTVNSELGVFFNHLSPPDLSHEDHFVQELNNKTLQKAILANVCFLICVIICVVIVYFFARNNNIDIDIIKILSQNFIILIFIALTEFLFFKYFAAKYISINPNETKLTVIENLQKIENLN